MRSRAPPGVLVLLRAALAICRLRRASRLLLAWSNRNRVAVVRLAGATVWQRYILQGQPCGSGTSCRGNAKRQKVVERRLPNNVEQKRLRAQAAAIRPHRLAGTSRDICCTLTSGGTARLLPAFIAHVPAAGLRVLQTNSEHQRRKFPGAGIQVPLTQNVVHLPGTSSGLLKRYDLVHYFGAGLH